MTTVTTTFADNFATFIDPSAPDFQYILSTAAGDFEDDFDIEHAVEDYVNALNRVVNPLGVDVTSSGVSYCDYYSEIDDEAVYEAANGVDIYDILYRNDRTR